jgi:GNAT superfamily N-acetyltransferase
MAAAVDRLSGVLRILRAGGGLQILLRAHAGRNAGARNEFRGLIATLDGRPVGLVHYLFHRHGWKIENVCYLQDLYADPEVRGKGIGRALIEAVYAAADAEGCPTSTG